jgi:hypothetical protein
LSGSAIAICPVSLRVASRERMRFQFFPRASKLAGQVRAGGFVAMRRKLVILVAISAVLTFCAGGAAFAGLAGPGPGITGNDTGGIIPYSPQVARTYRFLARAHCARYGRLSHITSVHRRYGDYIGFVCIDKPWIIH